MERYARDLLLRLLSAFAVGLGYPFFYMAIAPLTLHWAFFFFNVFQPYSALIGNTIQTQTASFEFIPACVATAAYILLAIIILLTKDISLSDRVQMFVYGSLAILAFNIIRTELLLLTYFKLDAVYNTLHLFVWKFMSTAFVVITWLVLAKVYKVRAIPVYSDVAHLVGMIRKK